MYTTKNFRKKEKVFWRKKVPDRKYFLQNQIKDEFQEIALTLSRLRFTEFTGGRHPQPPCLRLPRGVPVWSCDLLTCAPFHLQSPILDSTVHSHPAKRCLHTTTFFFPCEMVEPKEKGYFYKLRGARFWRRGILSAFSFQRLSAPSLWIGNAATNHFKSPFLV